MGGGPTATTPSSDDFDSLSVTDSGVYSDNDGCSSGRSSPISCKSGGLGLSNASSSSSSSSWNSIGHREHDRFSILTYDQVKRIDAVMNEVVALEGRGVPPIEVKLIEFLTAVKDRLLKEGLKIRDIRLNGGAASHALSPETEPYCYSCGINYGEEAPLLCSCSLESTAKSNSPTTTPIIPGLIKPNMSCSSYNDIDLIFGMELSTPLHFDRVKSAVLDVILDLLPSTVNRNLMSVLSLKEAYVSKMVKVCSESDRWSLIAIGNCTATSSLYPPPPSENHHHHHQNHSQQQSTENTDSQSKDASISSSSSNSPNSNVRSYSVELKFVDTMRRQYEFSVDSFQVILDSLMLFYKCATVPMTPRFYPTVIGESVYGDFSEALFHLRQGLISTRHPEEIRGGGLLKYCNLIVRGYRPADVHSIIPLQRYMCSRFFIDFPEADQQEIKLKTFLANHMSGIYGRLRYAFLVTLHNVVDSSTVCLMGHERRVTLQLIQRLAYELYANDYQNGLTSGNGSFFPPACYYMPPQYHNLPKSSANHHHQVSSASSNSSISSLGSNNNGNNNNNYLYQPHWYKRSGSNSSVASGSSSSSSSSSNGGRGSYYNSNNYYNKYNQHK